VTRVRTDKAGLWSRGGPRLSHLDIELTERCNNNCLHCYINRPAGDEKARRREMSAARVGEILREAASLGCLGVRFTGGEPLLRDDFEEIYLYARKLGMKVVILTNGTLIVPRIAGLLARIPPLAPLEITLYGMTRKSYEAVTRTRNSFGKAMAGVNRLLEKNIPFVVKGAFLPANADEIRAFDAWAETIPGMDKPPSLSIFHVLHARRERSKNRVIRYVRPVPEAGVKVLTRDPGAYLKGLRMFLKAFAGKRDERLFTCGAGMDSCSVDAYGRLQPCLLVRHPETVYDLDGGSLKDALDNFFPAIRKRKAGNPSYLERCARCPLRGFCEQCPGNSWMEDGTLDGPVDYFCEVAHVQAKVLGLLKSEEKAWEIADWEKRLDQFSEGDARKRLENPEGMNAPSLDET